MKNYRYTQNWFSPRNWLELIKLETGKDNHILEIGSFEGRSTIWFLENFLRNKNSSITCVDPWLNYSQTENSFQSYAMEQTEWKFKDDNIKANFLHNIVEFGEANKVYVEQGFSHELLPQLMARPKRFDLILIDGNHTAPFVMTDAIFSWYLLKPGGYIIFDDYLWSLDKKPTLRPKISIDAFVEIFADYLVVMGEGNTRIIRKNEEQPVAPNAL